MSEMFLPGSRNGLGDGSVAETLLSFFTGPGDWAYVVDYERYGVVSAMVTHREDDDPFSTIIRRRRIVIGLVCGTLYSVVRLPMTPEGVWQACELDITGNGLIGEPSYYATPELFDTFSRHANRP